MALRPLFWLLIAYASFGPEIGFRWDPVGMGWSRLGLPLLSNLAGPVQHFKSALLDAWRDKVSVDLCGP